MESDEEDLLSTAFSVSLSVSMSLYPFNFSLWVAREGADRVCSLGSAEMISKKTFFFGDFLIIMFLIIDICIDTPLKHML